MTIIMMIMIVTMMIMHDNHNDHVDHNNNDDDDVCKRQLWEQIEISRPSTANATQSLSSSPVM